MRRRAFPLTLAVVVAALGTGVVLSISDTVDLLEALSAFVWPLVAVWVLYRLLPTITSVVQSRAFQLEIGGLKVSVEQVLAQLPRQLDDLRAQVEGETGLERPAASDRERSITTTPGRILWVDDRPTANVYESETLLAEGWEIERAASTREAVETAAGRWERYSVVVSDMGREEDGRFSPDAGIQLTRVIREEASELPIYIYTSRRGWSRRPEAMAAGANGLTSSPTQLLTLIRSTSRASG